MRQSIRTLRHFQTCVDKSPLKRLINWWNCVEFRNFKNLQMLSVRSYGTGWRGLTTFALYMLADMKTYRHPVLVRGNVIMCIMYACMHQLINQ